MILKTISKYQPFNLLVYILVVIIFWSQLFFNAKTSSIQQDINPMPFYNMVFEFFSSQPVILGKITALLLVTLQGLLIIGIINQYNLIGIRTYLPGVLYVLITSNFPEYQSISPVVISTTFLLLAWNLVIGADFTDNTYGPYFNASLLIGISTLFYPNFLYFIIIFILSTFLNRMTNKREIGMLIGGILVVWYFYFSLFYIFTNRFELSGIEPDLNFSIKEFEHIEAGQKLFLIYLGFLLIVASIKSTKDLANQKIQLRRNQKFLFLWFMITIFVFIITKSGFEFIYLVAVPVSVLLSLFFSDKKYRWLKEFSFTLLVAITIINQYFPGLLLNYF